MSAISDILALAQPLVDDDPKTLAQTELDAAYERVDALVKTRPDDKEMLAEDQETWVGVWEQSLINLRACLLAARALGIHAVVRPHIAEGMAESQPFAARWTTEIASRRQEMERQEREERDREARERVAREQVESAAVEDNHGQQDGGDSAPSKQGERIEDGSGQTDEKVVEDGDSDKAESAPPAIKSTTSREGSSTSGVRLAYVQVPARAKRSRIILDDDEDEEDEDPRPVKKTTGGPPIVTHKTRCKACADRSEPCRGPEGRTCFVCAKLKIKCNKSPGRTRAQKAAEEEIVADRKGKGNAAARPTRVRREVEDPIELVDTEEEEHQKKVPRTKTQPKEQVAASIQDAGVRAVKRLEAKILKNQARMKASEAEMADMGAEVESQRVELDAIKRALGMNKLYVRSAPDSEWMVSDNVRRVSYAFEVNV
ncbi:hypothetical protein L210DRAFT_3640762 [Boletus edulis BED1]|uniref:Uncharacterized protein n=1 Tax=Boletus edulis BED1 TaxID=1328754 RepID=A0AAD4GK99_BOLED|nr:hypothetical protein L210DRAFT_3640762 [Boletus edulis BED1]